MSVKTESMKSSIDENPVSIPMRDLNENIKEDNFVEDNSTSFVPKETKTNYGLAFYNKSSCYTKNMKVPQSKRKFVSSLTDTSAKVVLSERNVEIKDLESKVKFLKNKMKELENENKILRNVQSRQERELKKFKEGITDIPALLKSHKEEVKVYESTISSIRQELRECQKELKLRNESLLKKENQINKLNVNLKQSKNVINDYSSKIKVIKVAENNLEEKNKVLIKTNEKLKNENEDLCKQIKDLNLKILNLEENLIKENDLNENLRKELNEIKEKCEKKQVLNIENIQDCENYPHSITTNEVSCEALNGRSVDCMENEAEKMENSFNKILDDPDMCSVKSVNNAKDALNHNFKSYQHFCIPQLKNSDTRLFEIGSKNIKLLPPLKTPTKISSTSVMSDLGKKEYFSSAPDINFTDGIKYSQCDVSTEYVQRKVSVADNEIVKLGNEKTCDSKLKEKSSFLDFLLRDDIKDCQNRNLKKDIQCIKMTDMNDLDMSQNSSFQSKSVTETKKYGSLNKPPKICDNLLFGNLKERVQNILQSNNVPDSNLKKENVAESSESVSKYWEDSINGKDFEYKSNRDKCKVDNSIHRRTFLKNGLNTKTITPCHLDETSEQKRSGIWFEVPWWDK